MEIKKELFPGIYEITRPDDSKIITGTGWATHIHQGPDWFNIKVEKTGKTIKGMPNFNSMVDNYLPDWMKK